METTSTTLRWAIVLLVSYPEVQEKLQNEIDRTVGRDRLPTMADKSDMPYASAVIMELQRRANISAVNLPHSTSEDVHIGGHFYPGWHTCLPANQLGHGQPGYFPRSQPVRSQFTALQYLGELWSQVCTGRCLGAPWANVTTWAKRFWEGWGVQNVALTKLWQKILGLHCIEWSFFSGMRTPWALVFGWCVRQAVCIIECK